MIRKLFFVVLMVMFFVACKESFYLGRINHEDKEGNNHGLIITWWDDEQNVPMMKNWCIHGKRIWKTKTYHSNGKLSLKIIPRGEKLRVKYYDTTGEITHKGWAKVIINEKETRYYWDGLWKYFDENHRDTIIYLYKKGAPVDTLKTN